MSNSQANKDQIMAEEEVTPAQQINKIAAERDELRELLTAFIDASVLKGFTVTQAQWEKACLLCGRYCAAFINHK